MQTLAAGALGALVVVSLLVAVRLLVLHRRTGALPELLLGGMLLLSVGIGYPMRVVADRATPEWGGIVLVVSDFAVALGFSLLFVFTLRVFRPGTLWARLLAAAGCLALLGAPVYTLLRLPERGVVGVLEAHPLEYLAHTLPVLIAYAWSGFESLRYHGMMRRRAKLGLADAAVSERFLLWGLMGGIAVCGISLNLGAALMRVDGLNSAAVLLGSSLTGLAQAVILVLAFMPPRSYLGWVRARTGAAPLEA